MNKYISKVTIVKVEKGKATMELELDLNSLAKDLASSLAESFRWCSLGVEQLVRETAKAFEIVTSQGMTKAQKEQLDRKIQDMAEPVERIPFTPDDVKSYLDGAIRYWRSQRGGEGENKSIAPYYVDAFQSVRTSIFGEMLE